MKKSGKSSLINYEIKLLSLSLISLFVGCIKEDCPSSEETHQTVHILPIWDDNSKKPGGVRVTYYSLESKKYAQENLSSDGGVTDIRKGEYSLILYNNDSEKIRFRNTSSYDTHEAYTSKISRPSYNNPVPNEETFDQPDILWWDKIDTFSITDDPKVINFYPKQAVRKYEGEIQIEGMEYVQAIRGAMTGMITTFRLNGKQAEGKPGTVFFDAHCLNEEVIFSFLSFGVYEREESCNSLKHYLTLEFLLPNGIVSRRIDVTQQMDSICEGGFLDIDQPIVIPPDTTDSDNGFNGNVGEWDEIFYPIGI